MDYSRRAVFIASSHGPTQRNSTAEFRYVGRCELGLRVTRCYVYIYRKLYWTEDGSGGNGRARIAQSNLDGSAVSTLYGDVVGPAGLGIEFGLKEDRYDVVF